MAGPAGSIGPAGARGTGWFVGSGPPTASIPGAISGDLYLDSSSGSVYQLQGFAVGDLPAIGASFQGGFYAGLISATADGAPTHALVIAPVSTGQTSLASKTTNTSTPGTDSVFDGLANSETMNNALHPAAQWARALTIGGFTDWYVPARDELEIIYRRFKPSNPPANVTNAGANAYAVPPTSNYTFSVPAATTVADYQPGQAQAFPATFLLTSTEFAAGAMFVKSFSDGSSTQSNKNNPLTVRAIRRVLVF